MMKMNKEDFIEKGVQTLEEIFEILVNLPAIKLKELQAGNTAMVIVDMINGFAREGALKSPRVEALIPGITALSKACEKQGIAKLAFADCHTEASPEFGAYPVHCMVGTNEAEVVDEIREAGRYKLIPKNSTNGFLEEEFQKWLDGNRHIKNFIITGDCTDICVQQFAITLKTWFNMKNEKARVIVPVNTVDTYDLGAHNGDLMNVMALFNMMVNGVEVVGGIEA